MNIISRIKNYGLWVSIVSFVPIFLQTFGVKILPEQYNELISSILSILVILGIVNNPTTNNNGFLDD